MNELALFAGAGGGILGGKMLGWRTVCAVERNAHAAQVLAQRQNDGSLKPFPIWSDVCSFDGRPWRGIVDVVSGGFPCQDISAAGRGAGINGKRSGLWAEMARIIREVRPRFVFVENSPILTSRGLGRVLGDLAALGFDAQWTVLSAADVGAPHIRERIWIVANTNSHQCASRAEQQSGRDQQRQTFVADGGNDVADSSSIRSECRRESARREAWRKADGYCEAPRSMANADIKHDDNVRHGAGEISQLEAADISRCENSLCDTNSQRLSQRKGEPGNYGTKFAAIERADWWAVEPDVGRVAHGVAHRVDRLRAIGNGQVPLCAATAWRMLSERLAESDG
jgi:DNA (cytosine-5)-methyltransferase 1